MSASPAVAFRCALAGALLLSAAARAEDWPRFRGADGSGISREGKPPTTWSESRNLKWKTELPGAGSSSPIVVGQKIFLTCCSGYGDGRGAGDPQKLERQLLCLNRADGRILWSATVPATQPEDNYGGYLTEHGFASHTPAIAGDALFLRSNRFLYCLESGAGGRAGE